jgi:hypothetical protein
MGGIYKMVRVLEVASGEYYSLLSDEDDIELTNVLRFIGSYKHLNPCLIEGPHFNFFSKELETSFRTFEFRFAYMSGIVLKRDIIDFHDLHNQLKKAKNGFLHAYPHIYIVNHLITIGPILSTNTIFYRERDIGTDFSDKFNNLHYSNIQSRFHQAISNLEYIRLNNKLDKNLKNRYHFPFIGDSYTNLSTQI